MSRTSLRNVSAAVLTILLCLAAMPAAAQPWRSPAPATMQTATGLLARAWLWLTGAWAPASGTEQVGLKASSSGPMAPDQLGGAGVGMNRGGTYDPNGS
jgi:hypothetical protein